MQYHFGKSMDSYRMKKGLDKGLSIQEMQSIAENYPGTETNDTCAACSSTSSMAKVEIFGFRYRECDDCGSLFMENMPDDVALEDLYRGERYSNVIEQLYANPEVVDYRIETIAVPKVEFVEQHMTSSKKSWLDIGCATGEVLSVADKRGFKTFGLEANETERQFAMDRHGLEVANEYIDETTLHKYKGQYGVISMYGVLEHIKDPQSIIRNIAAMQEPGDNLTLEVPHYPSISSYSQILFPDKVNRNIIPPFHLYLFSEKGLVKMLEAHGYKVKHIWLFGQDFYEFFSTVALFVDGLANSPLSDRFLEMGNDLQKVIDSHKLADQIFIVADRV